MKKLCPFCDHALDLHDNHGCRVATTLRSNAQSVVIVTMCWCRHSAAHEAAHEAEEVQHIEPSEPQAMTAGGAL